jgi:hypothetical protein
MRTYSMLILFEERGDPIDHAAGFVRSREGHRHRHRRPDAVDAPGR